ncbi:unnamed protein product [Hymenolepis diminuta]|uniref:Ricin B-type lectin domain-containing protein n=1 Tax=Hymenolepis diminuta TaxID=6216 RepID=A0A0R3SWL8_HYMDI|nr:unnamed protein product [Hymenolepis diminuta]
MSSLLMSSSHVDRWKSTERLDQLGTGYQMPQPANCMEDIYEIKLQTCDATPELTSKDRAFDVGWEQNLEEMEMLDVNHGSYVAQSVTLVFRIEHFFFWI